MNASTRIIVNTGAQYSRAVICALLSLYSTRLILNVLGMSDYGIYTLIAGVVALLGFITNALVITTQRYLSYHSGQGNKAYVRQIFANSLILHIVFALGIGGMLFAVMPLLFGGVLNIDADRIAVAKQIYLLAIVMLQISILIAPFKACYIAHENIVYISLVEIADAVLRVGIAIGLTYISIDKLLFYGSMMATISGLNLLAFAVYALIKFDECHLRGIGREFSKEIMKKLTGFAGWTAYGMGSIMGRNQGLAIIFNSFWGTAINASYGIGMQVYGSISFIATSVVNAFNPQIMKAEGAGNRQKMLLLAEQESKYSEMLLQLLLIPIIFEMPTILHFWLGIDNDNTTLFCRMMLIALMCDQITYGLNGANQALGNIRNYCLLMYTPKLLFVLVAYMLIHWGNSIQNVMLAYVAVELTMALIRLPYMQKTANLSIRHFVQKVFIPLLPLLCTQLLIGWYMIHHVTMRYRFVVTIGISILIGIVVVYYLVLKQDERNRIESAIVKRIRKGAES